MHLHLLHGTESGTAEFLCDDLKSVLSGDVECSVASLDDIDPLNMAEDRHYVIVVSTFGSGELPFTAQAFFAKIKAETPDLSHVRFSIFGLGDTTFDTTYNHGSEQMMNQMLACKARMIGERGMFDAASNEMPEDVAEVWLRQIISAQTVA